MNKMKIVHRFIQVKHRQGRHKKISIGDLLTPGKNGAFGLIKYLIAYLKIKSSGEFEGEIEDFVIITNDDFDSADSTSHPVRKLRMMPSGKNKGKEISVIRIDTQDEFLDVGDGVRYKFDDSIISYLQENKNFIKREVGREVSDKEIEDFLNKLVFAVNLPSGTELSEIIKSELGKEFSNTDAKHFYSRYQEEVLILLEKEEEEFLSYEKAKALLEEIREEILGAVWFGIIEPVASFTGRGRLLTALHNVLQRSAKKQAVISQVASISGLGGVGKSELARKYAYKYGKDYYDNVIWISAENSKTMESSFLDLAKDDKLGISPQDKYGNDKMIETIVKETYAFFARRGRKSLFIFDNAEGYKDISKFLPLSLDNKPYILITSRNKDWRISEDEGEIKTIQLGVFKETEALKFVKRALNIRNNLQDEEIKNLTEELQYFPLALKQAVAYINEKNVVLSYRGKEKIGVSDYLKKYEEEAEKLLDFESKYGGDRYTKTTFITWKITIDAIAQKECGFEALSILEIMAYLAPDKIHIEEIFSKLIADDEEKLWNAVKLLDRYSMIDLKEGVANIHRLVQKVTELNLQKEGREEDTLRKVLELINSGDLAKDSKIHVASIWGHASKHSRLVDDFYFNSSYMCRGALFIRKITPLHLLADSGDYKAISAIVTHIERHYPGKLVRTVNVKDNHGQTPLHIAARSGSLNIVKYLINKSADINAKDKYDNTPLHLAADTGEFDIVKYLIIKGNNINAEGERGWTPLHIAAKNGELNMVEYLVKKYANIDAKDNYGGTPLHLAAYVGELGIVEYLINEDAHVDARDEHYRTPLFFAAESGKLNAVKCLIEKGADVNARDEYDAVPLHLAVYIATFSRDLRMVEYMIKKGAYINAKNKNGETPLHYSVSFGSYSSYNIVEYLIQENADVNTKDENGNTPLHFAAMTGNVDIAKVLLKHNADVNAKNNEGKTALHYAANNNHQELVELLLAHGASHDY
ncbi:ankyrin repeat domain-containing protein [Wolbachia pipientis]|uniref:ankyrin repeat domain-containing protein n=1 Tax=Wolbachia pipientis TaxID=955 RepID=UPI0021C7CB24|nr:ankyrin repeat domain-containing protein [Wolbachia pipientis]